MDRRAMARNQRRRLIREAVELEQGREAMLLVQLEEMAAELEGSDIDGDAFARMTPVDADIVRTVLEDQIPGDAIEEGEEEPVEEWPAQDSSPEVQREEIVAEIARLEEEIAQSRRRQHAYERYKDALDG